MRSIGRKNIKIVKDEVIKAINENHNRWEVEEIVIDRLPSSLWDTWEMADSEIRRIISDTISEEENRR